MTTYKFIGRKGNSYFWLATQAEGGPRIYGVPVELFWSKHRDFNESEAIVDLRLDEVSSISN